MCNWKVRASRTMLAASLSFAFPAIAQTAAAAPSPMPLPAWAYPWDPAYAPPPDDGVPRRVADSSASYTLTYIRDLFTASDWHPQDHPPMPEIVARGRKPDVRACGVCHRTDGSGGPENASLAGLPREYIIQQMADYKSGARGFSGPKRAPVTLMNTTAKGATDAEVQAAADYFSALKPRRNLKVVESDTAPKVYVARTHYVTAAGGGTEPIGQRIVEVPVDADQFEHRDGRSQFNVYVPVGSLARGEALVKTGGAGATVPCAACHGADLKGAGAIPGIAGRSPSYIVRQLYDFKQGARAGAGSAAMQPTVANLTEGDMVALAAYLASLSP